MVKVFHHMDEDGRCAASVVAKFMGAENCEFFPINYGMVFPIDDIVLGDMVYIVDFSLDPNDMRALLKKTHNVVWIDHHITAINKYADFEEDIAGIREDGAAGCVLTWRWFTNNAIPEYIKRVGAYDVWKFTPGDATHQFYRALKIYDQNPAAGVWAQLDNREISVDEIQQYGNVLLKDDDVRNKLLCEHKGFDAVIEGFEDVKVFAVNQMNVSSLTFKSIDVTKYDVLVGFTFDGEHFVHSLRAAKQDEFDVTTIATAFGGGGHRNAAGFSSDRMVLKKRV